MASSYLATMEWMAKEAARLYVNQSVSGAMPQPMRIEVKGTSYHSQARCDAFPHAPSATLVVPSEWLLMDVDLVTPRLRELVQPILRDRRDYRCSVRHRVLGSMRVKHLSELVDWLPAERELARIHG